MPDSCANCGKPAPDAFCPYCGQKTRLGLPTLPELLSDGLAAVFSYDGKLWRTLRVLIGQPGALTAEFLAGRRQPYLSPLQLFVWLQAITFFAHRLWIDSANTDRISQLVLILGGLFWIALSIVYADRREPVLKHLVTTAHIWSFMMVFLLVLYGGMPLVLNMLVRLGVETSRLHAGLVMDISALLVMILYSTAALARVYKLKLPVTILRTLLVSVLTVGPIFIDRL